MQAEARSGYQEGALVVGKSLVENERKDLCIISPIMVHYVVKEVFRSNILAPISALLGLADSLA